MKIDCQTCPARQIACDGCMMQLLFDPVSSADVTSQQSVAIVSSGPADDGDLYAAIDSFCVAGMVDASEAASAIKGIAPRQGGAAARHLRILRAS